MTGPAVVGVARVTREAYADPTAEEGDWSCVDLAPEKPLPSPVPLGLIKGDRALAGISLIKQPRLSVMPVAAKEFERILKLGGVS